MSVTSREFRGAGGTLPARAKALLRLLGLFRTDASDPRYRGLVEMTPYKLAVRPLVAVAVLVTAPELARADNLDSVRRWMAQRFQASPEPTLRPTVHGPSFQRNSPPKRVMVDRGSNQASQGRPVLLRTAHRDRANSAPGLLRTTGMTPEPVIIYTPVIQRVYVLHW